MGNKNKKVHKSEKPRVSESALLKSLNDLEESILKGGDELLDQDPEGGLATEGEPLSKKAPKGKGADVEKGDGDDETSDTQSDDDDVEKGSDEESEDEESDDDSDDESEDESEDEESKEPPPMMKKTKKSVMKSFRESAEEDETLSKAIEVSEFLESLVDQVTETHSDMVKSFNDEIKTVKKSLDEGVAYQRNFNGRLAKGLIDMGKALVEVTNLVKSMSNNPNVPQRKSVLNKSEINQPMRRGDSGGNGDEEQFHPNKVAEWLFEKAMAGEIDSLLVTQFETHKTVNALPPQVRKALENDLLK